MTAVNVFFTRERGYLLTDGAFYTNEGLVTGFTQKAIAMPTLNAAIAMQGNVAVPGMVAQDLACTFASFDDVLAGAKDRFDAIYRGLEEQHGAAAVPKARLILIGWSQERSRPAGFCYDNTREPGDRFDEIDGWCAVPDLSEAEWQELQRKRLWGPVDPIGTFDPRKHGRELMEAQRRTPVVPLDSTTGEAACIVGGHILCTEISRDGVRQSVTHRWNDAPLENIEIEPLVPSAVVRVPPRGMSRQQRRAWERQHGSVAA